MPVDKLSKKDCCGCNACGDICPTNAINYKWDNEGFWYPNVNYSLCVNCGLCTKICPTINIDRLKRNDYNKPCCSIAAINRNMYERWNSTSGGAFSAFANIIYQEGGYVGGAIYSDDFKVVNFVSNNPSDLVRLRSSKYVESYAEGLYKNIQNILNRGSKVLVCGTPCQMAALRSYLRKDYDNLIIVDFICRGVNSPKIYRKYLDSLEESFKSKIISIKAKNKELGWRNLTRKVSFSDGQCYYGVLMEDDFRRGYHKNVFCRPSCYECVFKDFPRISDITLGDFWGIEKYAPNLDNNIGTSLVLLNSKKGEQFWEIVKNKFEYLKLPLESAFDGNIAIFKSLSRPLINRDEFFIDIEQKPFGYVVNKYFPRTKIIDDKSTLRNKLSFIYKLYRKWGLNLKQYMRFYSINERKNTHSNFKKNFLLYPEPGTILDIHESAKIYLECPLILGLRPIKGLSLPGCLKMEKGTSLVILGGKRDRYGDSKTPYKIKNGCYIEIVREGKLTFHSGASNIGLTIMCAKEITIGQGVRIGRNVSIRDWNGPHVIVSEGYQNHAPVYIGDRVWLCSGVSIMPGVTIGEGSVIGANSVVTRNIPPYSFAVGSPAKVIKSNIEWY